MQFQRLVHPRPHVKPYLLRKSKNLWIDCILQTPYLISMPSLPSSGRFAAEPTLSKPTADYVPHPVAGRRCSDCSMFRPPRACTLVLGSISPSGHCRHWEPLRGSSYHRHKEPPSNEQN